MLLNKEKFAKEIVEIVTNCEEDCFAINLHTKELCGCDSIYCIDCLFASPKKKL